MQDDTLVGDLTAPRWKVTGGGKIQVESKDDIRARLGRSTDDGDAVVMAFEPVRRRAQLLAGGIPLVMGGGGPARRDDRDDWLRGLRGG